MSRIRAVITGLGAISGFGAGAAPLWQGLVAGQRALVPAHEPLERAAGGEIGEPGDPLVLGRVPVLPRPETEPLRGPAAEDRARTLALAAATEAALDAGGLARGADLAVTVGTTLGGIGPWLAALRGEAPFDAARRFAWSGPAAAVAELHGAEGPVLTCSVACASGNAALGAALDLVRTGRARQVLAGGVDALCDFVIHGFATLRALDPGPCRPFDRRRRGLNLGEGACFVVVEAEAHARARGARIRAYLEGSGDAADAHHMTGPDPEGGGAARAMSAALADANADPGEIDFVSAHGTATGFNDLMEARALGRVFGGRADRIPVNSIKSAIGHTLGAAGAFEALLCVRVLETGLIPPTPGLEELDPEIRLDVVRDVARRGDVRTVISTSSGFGGTNATVVLRRYE
ncbi:MAG TPA: beta-ketoacyl-[acyl-carrier-protein] synthase family protein [Polyangia bacterium]|jgi:3-oxoacyl-[acyl-carrier-protein] synthase II|nr:beta-ketoacyl-[acyl-carrier-protein] synthase family protein [Polyangia bacterium]